MGTRSLFFFFAGLALWSEPISAQTQVAAPRLESSVLRTAAVLAPISFAAPSIGRAPGAFQVSLKSVITPAVAPVPRVTAMAAPQTPSADGQLTGLARQIEENKTPGRSPPAEEDQFGPAFDGGKQEAHPPRLIIAGPPGAGKSTSARKLAQDFGVVHIGVGDILREYAKSDPAAEERMQRGELVDSELVIRLVRERLQRPDAAANGFILDGFPRRLAEAKSMSGIPIDAVIHLKVPEGELRRRLKARGRADDTEAALKNRLRVYREQTLPAIEHLKRGIPVIESGGAYARVKAALERLLGRN